MPFGVRVSGHRCWFEFCKFNANLLVAVLMPELRAVCCLE